MVSRALLLTLILPLGLSPSPAACAASPATAEAADLANAGRYEEAAARFSQAISEDPRNPRLHLSLGLVYQSLQRYEEAMRSLEAAARLAPSLPEAYYSLALLYEAVAVDPGMLKSKPEPAAYWRKAKGAWSHYLRLAKDAAGRETAQKHLQRVSEEVETAR